MSYQIEQIALDMAAFRVGDTPATIDWLLTDSRSLSFPEATLFFALTTKRNSGAHYINELYQRGVRNFVVARRDYGEVESLKL
jgi:alanine racemase